MVKTILLPLDGSPLAERALPYAAGIARRSGARVVLVEAVLAHTLPGIDPSDAQLDVTDRARDNLRAAAARLEAAGVEAEPHVYYDDPVRAILDAARRQGADLIVMSTHGRSGLGRMVYGSVTDQVLRRATVPVLLVPSIVEHAWPADRPLSLLVPLDGSELAEEALRAADLLAEAFETRLTLLCVVQPPGYPLYGDGYAYVPFDEEVELAGARRYLDDHAAGLRAQGREVEVQVAVGQPAGLIPAVAREAQADVLVMATHGRGGLARLILGSVATSTVRQATVPLLLVRPAALHREEPREDAPMVAASTAGPPTSTGDAPGPIVEVRLSAVDLELIEHGLKAIAHAPGYDYGHVLAAQALARRLKDEAGAVAGEPISSR
jgi:nucleotide-binding universal stress UspA family protein